MDFNVSIPSHLPLLMSIIDIAKFLAIWQFSENSGQYVADTVGSRKLTLGSSTGPDAYDPVWSTVILYLATLL